MNLCKWSQEESEAQGLVVEAIHLKQFSEKIFWQQLEIRKAASCDCIIYKIEIFLSFSWAWFKTIILEVHVLLLYSTPFVWQVAQKLCEFHRLWKEGKLLQMQQQISSAPVKKFTPAVKSKASAAHSDSDDDDNDEEQLRGTEVPCNGYHKVMVAKLRRKTNCHVISLCCVLER